MWQVLLWLVWLNLFNAELFPRGTGKDRYPKMWGKKKTIPIATLSPPE